MRATASVFNEQKQHTVRILATVGRRHLANRIVDCIERKYLALVFLSRLRGGQRRALHADVQLDSVVFFKNHSPPRRRRPRNTALRRWDLGLMMPVRGEGTIAKSREFVKSLLHFLQFSCRGKPAPHRPTRPQPDPRKLSLLACLFLLLRSEMPRTGLPASTIVFILFSVRSVRSVPACTGTAVV
jgi:hypothetical protein